MNIKQLSVLGILLLLNACSMQQFNIAEENETLLKKNKLNNTLIFAAKSNSMERVHLALKNGADVNAQVFSGGDNATALSWAVFNNNFTMAFMLVNKHANVNFADSQGTTLLMYATGMSSNRVIELLLDSGALINSVDTVGSTALVYAVRAKRPSIVELLVSRGIDKNIANKHKRIALQIALELKNESIVDLLIK